MSCRKPVILIVAGSDPCGGAGLQADLKTVSALGAYGMTAVTAITVQNTCRVEAVHPLAPGLVADQIRICCEDVKPDAVKVGMLATAEVVAAVAEALRALDNVPVVVDPVLNASVGAELADAAVPEALVGCLFPLATVVTPNVPEAERLVGVRIQSAADAQAAAVALYRKGPKAVVVTGGHLTGPDRTDVLYDGLRHYEIRGEWVQGKHDHGTGCCYSAAFAVALARGLPLVSAARFAQQCVRKALRHGLALGTGRGPVDPMACYGD